MCIRTIKSIGLKEYASGLWNSVKEIDGGKILSSASSLLEVNVKAIKNKIDPLIGLKENVIIGKLIPAGTGMKIYKNISTAPAETGSAEDGAANEMI